MRFHGLMLLRDEIDIIDQNLRHLLSWIDTLYVLDMGSVDGTWDVVMDYAKRDSRIVPFFSKPIVYDDNLRSMLFDQYRPRFDRGDWVMKIDADEFYHVAPPRFVRERLAPLDSAVHLQWYFFRLTNKEVDDYESSRVDVMEDRKRPIEDRRRYYKISTYAEPRMFRYRPAMQWPQTVSFPFNAGFVSRQRIPIRHYPHRDPLQMEMRYRLRARMMTLKPHNFKHWSLDDWRKEIVDDYGVSTSVARGVPQGLAGERGIDTGELLYWQPGTELPEKRFHNHVGLTSKRAGQRLIHPMLLPILDRRRPKYDKTFKTTPIPQDLVNRMYDDTP